MEIKGVDHLLQTPDKNLAQTPFFPPSHNFNAALVSKSITKEEKTLHRPLLLNVKPPSSQPYNYTSANL
jgi:hypothetical protein